MTLAGWVRRRAHHLWALPLLPDRAVSCVVYAVRRATCWVGPHEPVWGLIPERDHCEWCGTILPGQAHRWDVVIPGGGGLGCTGCALVWSSGRHPRSYCPGGAAWK